MMLRDVKVLGLVLLVVCGGGGAAAKDDLKDKCGKESPKVMDCLSYAIGTADAPSKKCCDSVSSIKETDPVCLCYVIQQVHKGDSSVTSLGIKEDRLLKLPSECKLANASTTNCPKLLNLPAGSPDAAIFTNATTSHATSKTPGASPGGSTSQPATAGGDSGGSFKHAPQLAGVPLLAAAVAVVFWAFPSVV
ncbi:PREDICTED: non-specific lipid transfer protein GPI-anchored 1-like [Ipomoea nil]|uniref:non-specific lipid transfer protein GPI-anchored 1-like n=1 Tax=Ipomoea nil TaxID=35883 RepID=UPI00090175F5|nr:PREDICTED: non-specific lipid transfer protein GPI-anchored 1-like [Ipomoea nil]